ncbi:MAG: VanZ family protein [Lysobacterales bacterium]
MIAETSTLHGAPAWQRLRWWQALGWLGVGAVIVLSLLPLPQIGPQLPNGDKWQHLLAYATMALYFAQWASTWAQRIRQALSLLALGALLEVLQGLTGYRQMDPLDLLANATGIAIGAGLALGPPGRWLLAIDALLARVQTP